MISKPIHNEIWFAKWQAPSVIMAAMLLIWTLLPWFPELLGWVPIAGVLAMPLGREPFNRSSPIPFAILLLSFVVYTGLCHWVQLWPWPPLGAALVYLLGDWWFGKRQSMGQWFGASAMPQARAAMFLFGLGAVSAMMIFGWGIWFGHQSVHLCARLPLHLPGWQIVVVGILFACVNAFAEEVLFRGALLDQLRSIWPRFGNWAVLLASLPFAALHLKAYPSGALGILMTGSFAAVMGFIRLNDGTLWLPIAIHVLADAAILLSLGYSACGVFGV